MLKRLIKAKSLLVILSMALLITIPAQTFKADTASCAAAIADAAEAEAEMNHTCDTNGWSSNGCRAAHVTYYAMMATAGAECQ